MTLLEYQYYRNSSTILVLSSSVGVMAAAVSPIATLPDHRPNSSIYMYNQRLAQLPAQKDKCSTSSRALSLVLLVQLIPLPLLLPLIDTHIATANTHCHQPITSHRITTTN